MSIISVKYDKLYSVLTTIYDINEIKDNCVHLEIHDDSTFNILINNPKLIKKLSSSLQVLIINRTNMKELPKNIVKFKNLKKLSIYDNLISTIEYIGELVNLEELRIRYSNIEELPENIVNLKKLKYLYIGDNLMSTTKYIGDLVNLEMLEIGSKLNTCNVIGLTKLNKIRCLSLKRNYLTSIPDEVYDLTQLESLTLDYNKISILPEAIGNFINLKTFSITNNMLSFLPETIGNLVKLTDIYLSDNRIELLPETIGNLVNLEILDLNNNNLEALPETIGNLKELEDLFINDNYRLSYFPDSIFKLNLERINISGIRESDSLNKIHEVFKKKLFEE